MGLAFQTIATSGAVPVWESLAKSSSLTTPVMTFALTRFDDVSRATSVEPGGLFTIGEIDDSLFTGDINYNPLSDSGSYWLITLQGANVNGAFVNVSSSSVAIDTGTSLIGAPPGFVQSIYSQISGASPSNDPDLEGVSLFAFPPSRYRLIRY
jgi:cathepsin D